MGWSGSFPYECWTWFSFLPPSLWTILVKVLLIKSCGGLLLWNRFLDLDCFGLLWAGWRQKWCCKSYSFLSSAFNFLKLSLFWPKYACFALIAVIEIARIRTYIQWLWFYSGKMHFWIAGTALLVLRGSPEAGGITIDTATEPEENPIIDEWATSDVS